MKFAIQKISDLIGLMRNGMSSSVELTEECLRRIDELNPKLNAFITLNLDEALKEAKLADLERKRGKTVKKLLGVPIAIKDNIITKGIRTTCGSKMLEEYIPPYNATVIERLKQEGAIIIGKTNMDEFAMGSSNEYSHFGPVKNPWDLSRVPGGSSGGSAAAVAARLIPAALGSDTGGSVRQPASLCGVTGLKPTYGRISRYGLVAFASSLDQIGIFSNYTSDCALISEVLFGKDENDSTSAHEDVEEFSKDISSAPKGLRLGFVKEFLGSGIDSEVKDAFLKVIEHFKGSGYDVQEISLPHSAYSIAAYYIIANAEASANLARYDGVRYGYRSSDAGSVSDMYLATRSEGFGQEVKRRIMLGTFVLSSGYYDAYYSKAQKVRTLIKNDFDRAFQRVDVILSPTSPSCAFKLGDKMDNPLQMYLCDIYTTSVNLAGLPALSLPCGYSQSGLPIGLQLCGRAFGEGTLFKLASSYENSNKWNERHPKV